MSDAIQFPYQTVTNQRGEQLHRPMLPLQLTRNGESVRTLRLLNSGADVNVLPYQIGLDIGLDWNGQRTALTLSGNLANYDARGVLLDATIEGFAPVRLAFAWTQAETVPLILGQVNFFLEFSICFYRSEGRLELRLSS
jgi:hypothetical protein